MDIAAIVNVIEYTLMGLGFVTLCWAVASITKNISRLENEKKLRERELARLKAAQREPINCRSEDGVTIGLVDSIIFTSRVLAGGQLDYSLHNVSTLENQEVREALKDLYQDEDVQRVLEYAREVTEEDATEEGEEWAVQTKSTASSAFV
jgi:hypothetical protein